MEWHSGLVRRGRHEDQPKGHKLISESVALGRSFPLRWKPASFPFRYLTRGMNAEGERAQGHPMCRWDRVSVCRTPLHGTLPGTSRAKRRRGNQWISLGSRARGSRGLKRSLRCDSTPRERWDITAREPSGHPHRRTRGKDLLLGDIHHRQARRRRWCCACPVFWD